MLNPRSPLLSNGSDHTAKIDSQAVMPNSTLGEDKKVMLGLGLHFDPYLAPEDVPPAYERLPNASHSVLDFSKQNSFIDDESEDEWGSDDSDISEASHISEIVEKDYRKFAQYCADLEINVGNLQPTDFLNEALKDLKFEFYQFIKQYMAAEKSQRQELYSLFKSIAKNWSEEVSYGMMNSQGLDENNKYIHVQNQKSFEGIKAFYDAIRLQLKTGHMLRDSIVPLQEQYLDQANSEQFKRILQTHYTQIQEHSSCNQQILEELEKLHNKTNILNVNSNEMIKERFSKDCKTILKNDQSSELFKDFSTLKQTVDSTETKYKDDIARLWQQWDETIDANDNEFNDDTTSAITDNTIASDDPRLIHYNRDEDTVSSSKLFEAIGDEEAQATMQVRSHSPSIDIIQNNPLFIPVDNTPLIVFGAQATDNNSVQRSLDNQLNERAHRSESITSVEMQKSADSKHYETQNSDTRSIDTTSTSLKKKKHRRHSVAKSFYQDAQYEAGLCMRELENSTFLQEKCNMAIKKLEKLNPMASKINLESSRERLEKYLLKIKTHIQMLNANLETLQNNQKSSSTIADYSSIRKRHIHQAAVIAAIAQNAQGYHLGFHRIKLALTERFGIDDKTVQEKCDEMIRISKAYTSKAERSVRFDTKATNPSLTQQILQLKKTVLEDNKDRENFIKFSKFLHDLFAVLLKKTTEKLETVVKTPLDVLKTGIEDMYTLHIKHDHRAQDPNHFFQTKGKAHLRSRKHHKAPQEDWQLPSRVPVSV